MSIVNDKLNMEPSKADTSDEDEFLPGYPTLESYTQASCKPTTKVTNFSQNLLNLRDNYYLLRRIIF